MSAPRYTLPIRPQFQLGGMTSSVLIRWVPILGFWGVGLAGAGALFLSPIPLFQKDVLLKIPGVAAYYVDDTPDSDKPF